MAQTAKPKDQMKVTIVSVVEDDSELIRAIRWLLYDIPLSADISKSA